MTAYQQRRQLCGAGGYSAHATGHTGPLPASPSQQNQLSTVLCCLALPFCCSSADKGGSLRKGQLQPDEQCLPRGSQSTLPVCLPDMDGLRICNPVVHRLLIQQVKEVFDCQRDGAVGTEDHLEQVIHKLLQGALWRTKQDRVSTARGTRRAQASR